MKLEQLFQGEFSAGIAVHHKQLRRIAGENLVAEVVHAARGAQGREFLQVPGCGWSRGVFANSFVIMYYVINKTINEALSIGNELGLCVCK